MTDRASNRIKAIDQLARVHAEMRGLIREIDRHAPPPDLDLENGVDFYVAMAQHERSLITTALRITRGNQRDAARLLKLGTSTLCNKIKALGIDPNNFREPSEPK